MCGIVLRWRQSTRSDPKAALEELRELADETLQYGGQAWLLISSASASIQQSCQG